MDREIDRHTEIDRVGEIYKEIRQRQIDKGRERECESQI